MQNDEVNLCPRCLSPRICKAGWIWSGYHRIQRYRCNACGCTCLHPIRGKPGDASLKVAAPTQPGDNVAALVDQATSLALQLSPGELQTFFLSAIARARKVHEARGGELTRELLGHYAELMQVELAKEPKYQQKWELANE